MKHGLHILHIKSYTIYSPAIESFCCCLLLGKYHFDYLIRLRSFHILLAEKAVIPQKWFGLFPLGFTGMTFILNNGPHAITPVIVGKIAKYPNTRVFHFNNCRDTLGCANPQHRYFGRMRNSKSIQGNYFKGMARQRQAADLGSTPIHHMKKKTLALLNMNRLAMAKLPPVYGKYFISYFVPFCFYRRFLLCFILHRF